MMFDLINETYNEAITKYPILDQALREVGSPDDENRYYSYPGLGLEFVVHCESDLIAMVVLYRESQDAIALNSISTLPRGLSFEMSRSEVEDSFGKPEMYFEASTDPLLGRENSNARYRMNDYLLFITFSELETSVESVTYTTQFC